MGHFKLWFTHVHNVKYMFVEIEGQLTHTKIDIGERLTNSRIRRITEQAERCLIQGNSHFLSELIVSWKNLLP